MEIAARQIAEDEKKLGVIETREKETRKAYHSAKDNLILRIVPEQSWTLGSCLIRRGRQKHA